MVQARALEAIKNSDKIVGYKLQDDEGHIMDVNCSAIIGALKNNQINISNLRVTSDDKLEMIVNNESSTSKETGDPVKTENGLKNEKSSKEIHKTGNTDLDRMHELVDVLNKARFAYEQQDEEIMSNFEYDKLYDELKSLEEKTGTVLGNSPTANVGYEVVSELPKKKHETPMLSLDKTKEREALLAFLKGKEGVLSWKLDGLTVVLTYNHGVLQEAVTRGNGEIGEIVTANARTFENLPKKIAYDGLLRMRGEATISYKDFEEINNSLPFGEDPYRNPRNLCSGSVRQLDSSITAQRHVKWTCFNIEQCEREIPNQVDQQLALVKFLGFDVVGHVVVNPSNLLANIDKFDEAIKNGEMTVPSDGLVLTYRDRAYGNSLGRTTKFPRHSLAFKWQDEEEETTLQDIEWSVGKSGVITPVAIFNPVDIEGSTVSRASLHNVSIFLDMELGFGDTLKVYKANMIIPQISENLTRSRTCFIPETCPCCGYPVEVHEDPKSGVYTLWCVNDECEAKGNRVLKHFVSRDAMNIDGISGAKLEALSNAGIISDFASVFKIAEHRDEIINMEGFGVKSYENMVNAVDKARHVKVANLIYALGIPNIGLATAKLICKHFNNDIEKIVSASYEELLDIDQIGAVIADSFTSYFDDEEKFDGFVDLLKQLRIVQEKVSTDTSMSGVTICVTGDVCIFPNRRAIKDLVESLGGKLTGSVSRSTSYLVTNDTTSGSRKNKAAQEYGIPILTEQQFIDKFNLTV